MIDEQRHQVWGNEPELNLTTSQFSILVRLPLCRSRSSAVKTWKMAVWGDVLVDDRDRLKR